MVASKSSPALRLSRGLSALAAIGLLVGWTAAGRAADGADADLPVAADAPAAEVERFGGFAPFFEAAPHVVVQRGRGSVGTNFNFTSRKANYLTNMTFRFTGGLRGPVLVESFGRPRPVVYAGLLVPLNESSTIGTLLRETAQPGFELIETSKYSIEYQTSAMAGLGIEFEIPVFDEVMTVRPALESLHLVSRYVGEAGLERNGLAFTEVNTIRGKQDFTQHFLGPALRVGAPTVDVLGIATTFFVDASLLLDVAGTRDRFAATGANGARGNFTFETGKGLGQLSAGFQLRWP